MKLTKIAEQIKTEVTLELAKIGHTPWTFEAELRAINCADGAMKVAADLSSMGSAVGFAQPAMRAIGSLPGVALNASAAGGAIAGMTFDELENGVVDLNKALDREREKVHMVRRLTENLKKEHGLS